VRLRANGIDFAAIAEGPDDGPLVLLLHGFPELSRSWRHQLPALAVAGYRAVAPDLRGYGGTDARGPYDLRTLAADVDGLVSSLGRERATVVGHDWGGVIAWAAAHLHPERVEQLAILNAPHPVLMREELFASGEQRNRSRYIFRFQIPLWPEYRLSRQRGWRIARMLRGGSHVRERWTDDELAHYARAFDAPRKLRGPLAYYRTAFRSALLRRGPRLPGRIGAPTLVLWGMRDRFLGPSFADPTRLGKFASTLEVVRIEEAGHFVQNEAPERVNAELLRWLGGLGGTPLVAGARWSSRGKDAGSARIE
jgi:pimeloyl-ACP methyl ester carboxylesterase